VAGAPWTSGRNHADLWGVHAKGVPCSTATHLAATLTNQSTRVLAGPAGFRCYAQVLTHSAPALAGSCSTPSGSQQFSWQALTN
jgi:hypothetical protein